MKAIKKHTLDELVRMRAKYDYTVILNPPPFTKDQLDAEIARKKLNTVSSGVKQLSLNLSTI